MVHIYKWLKGNFSGLHIVINSEKKPKNQEGSTLVYIVFGFTLTYAITVYLCHKWPQICSICRHHNSVLSSFTSYHQVPRVTWWVPHMEQELLTLVEHLNSPPVFSGVLVARSLVFYVMLSRSLFVLLVIVLSVHLRFTASDYCCGIFKLFLKYVISFPGPWTVLT